jgi:uncharacterized protein with von Willebrand factor type A (vWA) domain
MNDRILEFSNLLRRHGIRVSMPENMDAILALDLIDAGQPAQFRQALRCTLIKQAADAPLFDQLFDLYFWGLQSRLKKIDEETAAAMDLGAKELESMLAAMRKLLEEWEGDASALARALLAGQSEQTGRVMVEALLEEAGERDLSRGALSAGTIREGLARDFEAFKIAARFLGVAPEMLERISRYAERRLQSFLRLLEELLSNGLEKREPSPSGPKAPDPLADKSFAYYSQDEIRRMKEVVERLARRFRTLLSARQHRAVRGRFDVKNTLRKNLQHGGVPFRVELRRRRREKPEVMVLCDISDSVLNASRFMLQFVYSIQDLCAKVRSFVFVSEIGEVTRLFSDHPVDRAVDLAFRGEVINVFVHSNFGRSFKLFYDRYLPDVTSRTTVLILGDGRNNYNPANEWVLREVQQKAKRLVWLNPESRLTWGLGDSEMPRYLPYCDVAEECRNIAQLSRVIDRMLA